MGDTDTLKRGNLMGYPVGPCRAGAAQPSGRPISDTRQFFTLS